jgi:hypothetical protein
VSAYVAQIQFGGTTTLKSPNETQRASGRDKVNLPQAPSAAEQA